MKRIALLTVLTLIAISGIQAQRTVEGYVKNTADNNGLPYTNIALLKAADSTFLRGTTSDANGHYSIAVDTFATLLRVSAIGYETVFVPIGDSDKQPDIMMHEGATTLDAIEIVDHKPMYAVDGEKKIYNVSEDPTVQNGTAQDAIQNAPGVLVDGDGNITLNGKSVTLYINDKEAHYSGEMLKQYIKTLPADQITSIEAIEFPSAKYGGGNPVINIKTGQKLLKNSYLSFGGNGSSRPSFSPFISYAYATDKLRFDAYVRYNGSQWTSKSDGEGTMLNEDSILVHDHSYRSTSRSTDHYMDLSFSFGYDFDSMNTLSAYVSTWPYWSHDNGISRQISHDSIGTQMEDLSYTSYYCSNSYSGGGYGSIDFEHKFNNEGHQISFSLGGNVYPYSENGNNLRIYDSQSTMNYAQRNTSSYPDGSVYASADYSLPYSEKGEINLGLNYTIDYDNSYYLRDTLGPDGQYHCDILRTDSSESPSNSTNLYMSWRRKIGDFTIRLGGSMNYENSSSRHIGLPEYDTSVHNLTFRPSILLMYNTKSMHSSSLNYNMSTSKPSASRLSRYTHYGIDNFSSGNPLLKPSYSHDIGANYDKSFEQGHSIGISANYRWEINEVSSLSMPVYSSFFGRYVSFSQPYNVGDSRKGNVYLYGKWRPSALFNMTLSGGVSDSWYRILVRPDEWFEDEMVSWNIRIVSRAKIFNLVWVSLSGYYNSRSHGWSAMSINEPGWGLDFSASADLLDRKLSFYLNVNDIFKTNHYNSSNINPYAPSTDNYSYNSQYITFGVTLRFGKMELGNSGKEGIQASSGGKGGGK